LGSQFREQPNRAIRIALREGLLRLLEAGFGRLREEYRRGKE
jgi:hypothetical protein